MFIKVFFKLFDHHRVIILLHLSLHYLSQGFSSHSALQSRIHAKVLILLTLLKGCVLVTFRTIPITLHLCEVAYHNLGEVVCPHLNLHNGHPHGLIRQQHLLEANIQELRVQCHYFIEGLH